MNTYQSVDEYLQTLPPEQQVIMQKIRKLIKKEAPTATEAISYQMPTYKLDGKVVIHVAAWKDHIGIYPTPEGVMAFEADLQPYKKAKGSIRLPLDQPMPYELITKLVRLRVTQLKAN